MKSDLIDVEVMLKAETAKAYLVYDADPSEAVWVPKSQCELEKNNGTCTLTLPEWLAKEKGLI